MTWSAQHQLPLDWRAGADEWSEVKYVGWSEEGSGKESGKGRSEVGWSGVKWVQVKSSQMNWSEVKWCTFAY